jgi:hypothetical protein
MIERRIADASRVHPDSRVVPRLSGKPHARLDERPRFEVEALERDHVALVTVQDDNAGEVAVLRQVNAEHVVY